MGRQNVQVSAEQVIALQAALTDLSDLYSIARSFAALQARAEGDLLPRIHTLGARLRRLVRAGQLSDAAINQTATEVLGLAAHWRSELDGLRCSLEYQRAVRAVRARRRDSTGARGFGGGAAGAVSLLPGITLHRAAPTGQ
jgi:hypothetical protein